MTLSRLTLPLSVVIVMAGCGNATVAPGPQGAAGEWRTQSIEASVGADQPPLLATAGDDAVVLTVSEDGSLLSHLSEGGGAFRPGAPMATGLGYLQLGDVVGLPDGGWFAMGSGGTADKGGDTELRFDPVAFRSDDGLTWRRVDLTGIDQPIDVSDLEVVDGTLIAVGVARTAEDPAMGGFVARLWTSPDAAAFAAVDLPGVPEPRGYRHESRAARIAVADGRVLVAGRVDDRATVWSADLGLTTWDLADDPVLADAYDVSGLAVVDDVVLLGVGDGPATALRSTDGGASWTAVGALPLEGEELGWAPVWAGGGRFWTLTGIDDESWNRPEVCYADLTQCGQQPQPRLVTSGDAVDWTAVDLPGEPSAIGGTADGRVLVLTPTAGGLEVLTLPAGASPPRASATAEPRTVELVTVEEGEVPAVGVRYHAPMFVHCGMDWLWFADTSWRRTDDGPGLETGAGDGAPDDWPLVGQTLYGYATLTDPTHLDYSFDDDRVVATYVEDDNAPGCD